MAKSTKRSIAKIDNQFVMKSHYSLSANEQKLILFLVSMIDPKKRENFTEQTAKVTDIKKALSNDTKHWGTFYDRLDLMCKNIMEKSITIPKGFVVKGKEITMHEYYHWFDAIKPFKDDEGEISIKFKFSDQLKDFLLQLSKYVQINLIEVMPIQGKHAIRMIQIFKAEYNRMKGHKDVCHIVYGVEELKALLGIEGKYKSVKDFRKWVLDQMKREINEHSTQINIDYEYIKTGRKVTNIKFMIYEAPVYQKQRERLIPKSALKDFVPSKEDVQKLTYAQLKAYQILKDFGVYEGIAYKQIIPTIKAGDLEGYEDIFTKNAIDHFLKWTNKDKKNTEANAGTFVKWWTENKIFDSKKENTVYWKIAEKVRAEKDRMTPDRREARLQSIGLPHEEFVKVYHSKEVTTIEQDEYKDNMLKLKDRMEID